MGGVYEPCGDFAVRMDTADHAALGRLVQALGVFCVPPEPADVDALEALVERIAPAPPRPFDLVQLSERERLGLQRLLAAVRSGEVVEPAEAPIDLLEDMAHRYRIAAHEAAAGQEAIGSRAWLSRHLGPEARRALAAAIATLTDDLLDSLEQVRAGVPLHETLFGWRLPERPYPPTFPRRFLACFMSVSAKLAGQTQPYACCVAEEISLFVIFEAAEALAGDLGSPWHSETAEAELRGCDLLEDTDFILLWDPTHPAPDVQGWTIAPDAPIEQWFDPFNASRGEVHPYAAGSERR